MDRLIDELQSLSKEHINRTRDNIDEEQYQMLVEELKIRAKRGFTSAVLDLIVKDIEYRTNIRVSETYLKKRLIMSGLNLTESCGSTHIKWGV